jgi:putative ABC transport system permease protein
MRPTTIALYYWWRLRAQPLQELLAAAGIAAGVALVFSVQVANSSISGSVEQLVHGITGSFTVQMASRDARGFDQRMTARIAAIDGVRRVAPILQQRVGIEGERAETNVELLGVTRAILESGGPLADGFGGPFGLRLAPALLMPRPLAARLGVEARDFVALATRRRQAVRAPVSALLDRAQVGTAIDSPIVVAEPGRQEAVRQALQRLAGGRLSVQPSDIEIDYVRQAATPNNQSTGLFAAICAIVGILFTFNAMLLTVPERRRFVAELRMEGYRRSQVIRYVVFEAVTLGLVASALGIVLGDQLSRHVFHSAPGYLSFAFAVGGHRIVPTASIVLSLAGGVAATLIAVTPLLRSLYSRTPIDTMVGDAEEPAGEDGGRAPVLLALAGIGLMLATTFVVLVAPATTVVAVAVLAVAMLALVPALLAVMLRLMDRLADRVRGSALSMAVMQLSGSLIRATALAATGALAIFGSVAIQGAHKDLLRGLDVTAGNLLGTAQVWVTAAGDENILMTTPFALPDQERIRASGVVSGLRRYRGEFLDIGDRRVWVMGRPPNDRMLIPPSQILSGNVQRATQAIRDGGAAAVSRPIADQFDVDVGDDLAIPTPSGMRQVRVAAVVSNLGWAPGSIVMNGDDYRRWWPSSDVTALEVDLRPGVMPTAGKRAVQNALGPGSPLLVETQAQRKARFARLERQGLNRLTQISSLLLFAAVLAMGAAMAGAVWEQRRRIASWRMEGFPVWRVLRILLTQALLVLTAGAIIGAVVGLYGQALGTRWLRISTGFPTIFAVAGPLALTTLVIVTVLALVIVTIPGYLAAKTRPELALHGD